MTTDERQQRMAERILEDENLRGDLEDDAASALVDWASKQAAAAAADPDRSDAAVEAQVQAIRQAARAAALSGETAPRRLIALAAARLGPSQPSADAKPSAAASGAPTSSGQTSETSAPTAQAAVSDAAAQAVGQPSKPADAAASASPSAPAAEQPSASAAQTTKPEPAKPASNRPRRKRSRLARFFKHVLGKR